MSSNVKAFFLLVFLSWNSLAPSAMAFSASSDEQPSWNHPTLAELGTLYRKLELPLPPKDVGFAIVGSGLRVWQRDRPVLDGRGPLESEFRIRLATEDPKAPGIYLVWRGLELELDEGIEQFQRTAPSPDLVLQVMKMEPPNPDRGFPIPRNDELIFAIQCHLLGHKDLAAFFYRRCQKTVSEPLEQTLLIEAWNHWARQIYASSVDRVTLARKFKILVEDHNFAPWIAEKLTADPKHQRWLQVQHQSLVDQLDLTLKPVYGASAKPGSVPSLIDELPHALSPYQPIASVQSTVNPWDRQQQIQLRRLYAGSQRRQPDMERKLTLLGFEAIPLLIDQIDDKRLSRVPLGGDGRGSGPGVRTFIARDFTTVGDRVREVLLTFFDFDLSVDHDSDRWTATKSDFLSAWKAISARTESDFVLKKLSKPEQIHSYFLGFIKAKYPQQTIELYKKLLKNHEELDYFGDLVYFVVDSNLPLSEKRDLLVKGVQHPLPTYRLHALEGLLELDEKAFTKHCLELLSRLPKDSPDNEGTWQQAAMVNLGLCVQDSAALQTVVSMFQRLPVSMKISVLAQLPIGTYRPTKNQALAFLAQLLEDSAIYHKDEDHHMDRFTKIEVRNYAAFQILEILDIRLSLNDQTTKDEWKKVRAFVQDEVERRRELEKGK